MVLGLKNSNCPKGLGSESSGYHPTYMIHICHIYKRANSTTQWKVCFSFPAAFIKYFKPPVAYANDPSKAVVLILFLFRVALCFIGPTASVVIVHTV